MFVKTPYSEGIQFLNDRIRSLSRQIEEAREEMARAEETVTYMKQMERYFMADAIDTGRVTEQDLFDSIGPAPKGTPSVHASNPLYQAVIEVLRKEAALTPYQIYDRLESAGYPYFASDPVHRRRGFMRSFNKIAGEFSFDKESQSYSLPGRLAGL